MKKQIMRVAAMGMSLAMAAGVMSGCGDSKKSSADADGKIVITVGDYFADETVNPEAYAKNMKKVAEFEKLHPDIKIEDANWGFDVQSYMAKAEAGILPTIYYAPLTETKKIIEMGYAADLTDEFKERGFYDEVNSYMLELISDDRGKIYFLPSGNYDVGIAVNVKLYGDAGFVNDDGTLYQPTDWDDLARVAKTIKEKTGADGFMIPTTGNCGGWRVTPIAWSNGVTFETKEGGKWKATFNTPECTAALQYIKDLKWKYDVLPGNALIDLTEYYKQYGTDNAGMLIAPGSATSNVSQYGMDVNKVGALAMPKGPKKHVTLLGGAIYSVSAAATEKQIDAAVRWIKMAYNPDLTEDVKTIGNADIDEQIDEGEMIGTNKLNVWNKDADSVKYLNQLNAQRANANINHVKLYNDFVADMGDCELRAEEPVCAQELYGTLDNCIQEVLTNKDADCAALLEKACSDFQKNYLDNIEF